MLFLLVSASFEAAVMPGQTAAARQAGCQLTEDEGRLQPALPMLASDVESVTGIRMNGLRRFVLKRVQKKIRKLIMQERAAPPQDEPSEEGKSGVASLILGALALFMLSLTFGGSILAFVLGFLLSLIGLIVGVAAMKQGGSNEEAIVGIILSSIGLLFSLFLSGALIAFNL